MCYLLFTRLYKGHKNKRGLVVKKYFSEGVQRDEEGMEKIDNIYDEIVR